MELSAAANEPTVISTPAISMTRLRPNRVEIPPANQAPVAHPSRTIATTNPTAPVLSSSVSSIPLIAEFIVEVSKPKSNPPSAALAATIVTYRVPVGVVANLLLRPLQRRAALID